MRQHKMKRFRNYYVGLPPEVMVAAHRELLRRVEAGRQRVSIAALLREAIEGAAWVKMNDAANR